MKKHGIMLGELDFDAKQGYYPEHVIKSHKRWYAQGFMSAAIENKKSLLVSVVKDSGIPMPSQWELKDGVYFYKG